MHARWKRKGLNALIFSLIASFLAFQLPAKSYAASTALNVGGTNHMYLVNSAGTRFIMKGTQVYLAPFYYTNPGPSWADTKQPGGIISDLSVFTTAYSNRSSQLDAMKNSGINTIRVFINEKLANDTDNGYGGFNGLMDALVNYASDARTRNMYVVYTMNTGSFDAADGTAYTNFVNALTSRLNSNTNVMYEVTNEPEYVNSWDLTPKVTRAIDAFRAAGYTGPLVCPHNHSDNSWDDSYVSTVMAHDNNVLFTLHWYDFIGFDGQTKVMLEKVNTAHVPTILGEFGVNYGGGSNYYAAVQTSDKMYDEVLNHNVTGAIAFAWNWHNNADNDMTYEDTSSELATALNTWGQGYVDNYASKLPDFWGGSLPVIALNIPANGSDGLLSRASWTVKASSFSNGTIPEWAIDKNEGSVWSTGAAQNGSEFLTIDMHVARTFDKLVIDNSNSGVSGDFPRSYAIYVSSDGTNWGSPIATGTGSTVTTATFSQQTKRYIRVNQTASSGSWLGIKELNLFNTGGSVPTPPTGVLNRAGWNVTSSSDANGDVASKAIDGSAATRWTSGKLQSGDEWYKIDLGSSQTFNKIVLDSTNSSNDYGRAYSVYVSDDGTNWGSAVANGAGSAITTITFPSQTKRYIRVNQTGSTGSAWWSIHELNVYNDSVTPPPSGSPLNRTSWTVAASSDANGDVASKAIDGSAATRWTSGKLQAGDEYYKIDLGSSQSFNKIVLDSTNSGGDYGRNYAVYVSADGTNWGTAIATGSGAVITTITFSSQTKRYIRINQTVTGNSWWSIHELNVYN